MPTHLRGGKSSMKVFLDSVRLHEIEDAVARGIVSGVTINPNFLREEIPARPLAHIKKIIELIRPCGAALHVQIQTTRASEMVRWTETIRRELDYPQFFIK